MVTDIDKRKADFLFQTVTLLEIDETLKYLPMFRFTFLVYIFGQLPDL